MIKCVCGYENADSEKVCGMCKAVLHKATAEEKKEEIKEQWSFTNVGAIRQNVSPVNPLKVEGASAGRSSGLKNIFIILGLTILLGAGGLFGTAFTAQKMMSRSKAKVPVSRGGDLSDIQALQRETGRAMSDMEKRQTYALVGGAVGAGLGFLISIIAVIRMNKK